MRTDWYNFFKRHDELVIDRISAILPKCNKLLGNDPAENDITKNLVYQFDHDWAMRANFYDWQEQFPPPLTKASGSVFSSGVLDLALYWDRNKRKYLGYEIKRLNVTFPTGKKTLAKEYVENGVARFVAGTYSKSLPLGCMLGIVIDGNVSKAAVKVKSEVKKHKSTQKTKIAINLIAGPFSLNPIGSSTRFETKHYRADTKDMISICHSLLPYI